MPRRELGLYAEKCPERGRDLREEVVPRLAAWLGRAGMGGVGEELFGKLSVREGGGGTWGMLAAGNSLVSFQKSEIWLSVSDSNHKKVETVGILCISHSLWCEFLLLLILNT